MMIATMTRTTGYAANGRCNNSFSLPPSIDLTFGSTGDADDATTIVTLANMVVIIALLGTQGVLREYFSSAPLGLLRW